LGEFVFIDDMKKSLIEQLRRIHELSYDKKVINEVYNKIGINEYDDPKKADFVSDDVREFFKTLEDAANSGGLTQQRSTDYKFQKAVESMQIGLTLLGYKLPIFGTDGLFGPETASAVKKFNLDNDKGLNESIEFVKSTGIIGRPGQGTHSAAGWTNNNAWDVAAPVGAEVKSLTSGVVKLFKKGSGGLSKQGVLKVYGDQVVIKSNDGNPDVFYTHIDSLVTLGQEVNVGDTVGTIMQVSGIPSHVHVALSSGNLSDLASNLPSNVGGGTSKVDYPQEDELTQATPDMLNLLIDKLLSRGVKSEELKPLIDINMIKTPLKDSDLTDHKDSIVEKNVIIGDSQTPYVDMNTTKASRIKYLCKGGVGVNWLKDRLSTYDAKPEVENVILVIGTNGVFGMYLNDDINGLFNNIKKCFPNAKILVVQGSWGWTRGNHVPEEFVRNYYKKYEDLGGVIIEPPIGEIEPHQNHPVYKTIGSNIDRQLD
jgi:murein DD-endopeptidase MepM/ murein hydrolase activator NlpD